MRRFIGRHGRGVLGLVIAALVLIAAVFVFSVTYTLINLVVDLLYGWLDPRTRRRARA